MTRSPTIISRSNQRRFLLGALLVALPMAMSWGCTEDVSIRMYSVAKDDSRDPSSSVARTSTVSAKDQLMLGAIVPNKDTAWFFKLTGEPDVVAKSNDPFRGMVQSVQFDGSGQPSWKLSEGWKQQITPNDITYGKLMHDESGLTATVTRLPFTSEPTEESWRGYVASNINRWRNQLSLQKQEWSDMSGELEELPELSQGPSKAYFVSIAGKGSAGGGMGPFMSRGGSTAPASPPHSEPPAIREATTAAEAAPEKPISYQVPESWIETAASGMRMAAFSMTEGETSGEVTVIAAGGDIDANIGIWLGQVSMEASDENRKKILEAAEELTVNGITAKLYTIDGTVANESKQAATNSILIADIQWREGQSLFVKFKGPSAMAQSQRDNFIDFVETIVWKE